MRVLRTMRACLADPEAFGRVMAGSSRFGWRILLIAAAGETLTNLERIEFKKLTGRDREPGRMCHEIIIAAGRRAGKTSAMTIAAAWISIYCDHTDVLAPGEVGTVLIISRDQRAAKIVLERFEGLLLSVDPEKSPLSGMLANRTQEAIMLTNGVSVEVRPCSRVSVRGPTYLCAIADEIGFWFTEINAANPDVDIISSVKPGLLTTRGPILMASSVYAKRGVLYDNWKKYYGPNGPSDILVAYGTSRDFNPSLPQEVIDRELEKDPTGARAEYLSEWRDDIAGFISREVVEACVRDWLELPPQPGIMFVAFVDAASGVDGGDSFAIVIAHKSGDRVVIDAIREIRPPFSAPDVINNTLVPICRAYNISSVTGDDWAADLLKGLIRNAGLGYNKVAKNKSQLYLDPCLSLLNAAKLDLPRHDRLISQFCQLERTVRGGHEHIDHPTHGHDDVANAVAGAAAAAFSYTLFDQSWSWVDGVGIGEKPADAEARRQQEADSNAAWQRQRFDNYLRGLQHPGLNPMTGRPSSLWDSMPGRSIIWR
jgi:hypothetical protein